MKHLNYRWPLHLTLLLDALSKQSPQPAERLLTQNMQCAASQLQDKLELTEKQLRQDVSVALKKLVKIRWVTENQGKYSITTAGRTWRKQHPTEIFSQKTAEKLFREILAAQQKQPALQSSQTQTPAKSSKAELAAASNRERQHQQHALKQHAEELSHTAIINSLYELSPKDFEIACINIVKASGYGNTYPHIIHTGGTGDSGIDGILTGNPLELGKLLIQSKRYAPTKPVSANDVKQFIGTFSTDHHATAGILITTSSFHPLVQEVAEQTSAHIKLIDGKQLAQLIIDRGICTYNVPVTIKALDSVQLLNS